MSPPTNTEPSGIFRQGALARLASPERLDLLVEVVTPQTRLAVGALFACAVAAVVWGFAGSLPTKVRAPCMITRAGGAVEVTAGSRGRIAELPVQDGDRVRAGDVLARIDQPELRLAVAAAEQRVAELRARGAPDPAGVLRGGKEGREASALSRELNDAQSRLGARRAELEAQSLVRSTLTGRVLEVRIGGVGTLVDIATPLLILEPEGSGTGRQLEVSIFAPPGDGKNIRPGMDVQISPANVRREEAGFLEGKVRWVADYPSSQQGIMRVLQNERLVEQLAGGAPIKVLADLVPDPASPSGYRWSSGRGPRSPVDSGTLCEAAITLERRAPITLVLPLLRRSFGAD